MAEETPHVEATIIGASDNHNQPTTDPTTTNLTLTVASTEIIPDRLIPLINNFQTRVTVKLNTSNFIVWRGQVRFAFRAFKILHFLDAGPPRRQIINDDGVLTPNPEYAQWVTVDGHLLSCLAATLSETIATSVTRYETAGELYRALDRRFTVLSRSHIHKLMDKLAEADKKNDSMETYLATMTEIADQLALASAPVSHEDLIYHILNGLPKEYQSLKTHVRSRSEHISIEELSGLLCSEEIHLAREAKRQQIQESYTSAYSTYRNGESSSSNSSNRGNRSGGRGGHRGGRGNRGGGRQGGRNNFAQQPEHQRGPCQICGRKQHTAIECWYRMDPSYQSPPLSTVPQTYFTSGPPAPPPRWFLDSGSTDHITNDMSNLSMTSAYQGNDHVAVGNGQRLQIHNTGQVHEEDTVSRSHP